MSHLELDLFIGRFHPLMVHLPIGFIILTIILEIYGQFRKESESLSKIIRLCYPISVIASLFAVFTGWLLSGDKIYPPDILSTHKWLGIATLSLVSIAWITKLKFQKATRLNTFIGSMMMMIIIGFTGHFGGVLTHGNEYLFKYAPDFIAKNIDSNNKKHIASFISQPDSLIIYKDIILPVFEKKCTSCHNSDDTFGDFNASVYHLLFESLNDGIPVVPGSVTSSEIFRRITLPPGDRKFMPTWGEPLSYGETLIMRYWIENGADSLGRFAFNKMDLELVDLMIRDYNLDYRQKPYYEKERVDTLDTTLISILTEEGYAIKYLGEENYFLDVRYEGDSITDSKMDLFNDIRGNVTFLDLSGKMITDTLLSKLSVLSQLTRLDLHDNPISDAGINHLLNFEHLESLNLFNTRITDEGLKELLQLPSLKNIYVWNSEVTVEGVNKLSKDFPSIAVDNGFKFNSSLIPGEEKVTR